MLSYLLEKSSITPQTKPRHGGHFQGCTLAPISNNAAEVPSCCLEDLGQCFSYSCIGGFQRQQAPSYPSRRAIPRACRPLRSHSPSQPTSLSGDGTKTKTFPSNPPSSCSLNNFGFLINSCQTCQITLGTTKQFLNIHKPQ